MSNIEVKVRAAAYNKGHVKKKLSEFENDLEVATPEQVVQNAEEIKRWVKTYIAQNITGATPTGLSGGDVSNLQDDGNVVVGRILYGGNISEILGG